MQYYEYISQSLDEVIIFCHLCIVVNIDNVDRPVSIADEEHCVIIRLQHLQKVDICPTIDENKIAELQNISMTVSVELLIDSSVTGPL